MDAQQQTQDNGVQEQNAQQAQQQYQAPIQQQVAQPSLHQVHAPPQLGPTSPQQMQHQGPRLRYQGNPNLWLLLSQTTNEANGDFEKTECLSIHLLGMLIRCTAVYNGRPTMALVLVPSIKIVQAVDPKTGQPLVDSVSGAPLPTLASTNAPA
jgi:hypothetical protein